MVSWKFFPLESSSCGKRLKRCSGSPHVVIWWHAWLGYRFDGVCERQNTSIDGPLRMCRVYNVISGVFFSTGSHLETKAEPALKQLYCIQSRRQLWNSLTSCWLRGAMTHQAAGGRPRAVSLPPCRTLYPLLEEQTDVVGPKAPSGQSGEFPPKLHHSRSFSDSSSGKRIPDYAYIHMISSMDFDKCSWSKVSPDLRVPASSQNCDASLSKEGRANVGGSTELSSIDWCCFKTPMRWCGRIIITTTTTIITTTTTIIIITTFRKYRGQVLNFWDKSWRLSNFLTEY